MKSFIRYIGGKNKIVKEISVRLHATGKTCLVDVFGGSGAVTIHSGFMKRVYNDIDGDLVNLFRVIADRKLRRELLEKLRWTPPSRQIFKEDYEIYQAGNYSFKSVECPVERARKTFYRLSFCFGGKMRCGGFALSFLDSRKQIKEVRKYNNVLRALAEFGEFFRNTAIENLSFDELIDKYGNNPEVVFFIDPPYPGFPAYYSHNFSEDLHRDLASLLVQKQAPAVFTFYDHPLIRELYPESLYEYETVRGFKNMVQGSESTCDELILTKRSGIPQELTDQHITQISPQLEMVF